MRIIDLSARSAATLGAIVVAAATGASGQSPDLDRLLQRIGERIDRYYARVQSIVCNEKITNQPVASDMSPFGFARVVEYELRVEPEATEDGKATDAKVVRTLKKVNGRVPKPKDLAVKKTDIQKCLDPNPLSPEPLNFLLAANRHEYEFSWAGFGKEKDQRAYLVDYRKRENGKPEIRRADSGIEGCYNFETPGLVKGRIWLDPETLDVLRVEEHLMSRVDIRVPFTLQRRDNLPDSVVIERQDLFIRYKPVTFSDPSETLLLPHTIDNLLIVRGGSFSSHRTQQVYTDYQRFLTAGRLVK